MENPLDRAKVPALSREDQNALDEAMRRASQELGAAASRDQLSQRALELVPEVKREAIRDTVPPPPPQE